MEPKEDFRHIKGWGVDADPENEPTYPIKDYTGEDHARLAWTRPVLQKKTVEVLHSNERPALTATFGTNAPPSGLSGMIRRFAFHYSEGSYLHWLPLLLADRVNVVEGILHDLVHGHIPNVYAERGWKAEWKHSKGKLALKLAGRLAVLGAVTVLVSRSSRGKRTFGKMLLALKKIPGRRE